MISMDKGSAMVLSTAIIVIGVVLIIALLTDHDTVLALSGLTMIGGIAGYRIGRKR